MLVSYKGAQPQKLPAEHSYKTEAELNSIGFIVCSDKPNVIAGHVLSWENNDWVVREPNSAELEIQWQLIKNKRDLLLEETNKSIIESYENHETLSNEMIFYRNNLRDITLQENPFDIQWPSLPTITRTVLDDVRSEAGRRILSVYPEWKQRNYSTRATLLIEKGRSNWTAAELIEWDDINIMWSKISDIRDHSNILSNMNPIPSDYINDVYWPTQ